MKDEITATTAAKGHSFVLHNSPFILSFRIWRGCLQRRIFSRGTLVGLLLGFAGAWGVGYGLVNGCGMASGVYPFHLILGSMILNFCLLGLLLAMLPSRLEHWGYGAVWLQWVLVSAAGYGGLCLSGEESARTFLSLTLLSVAQGAVLAAGVALLGIVLAGRVFLAKQLCGLLLALAVTAIFWTKTPIQSAPKSEADGNANSVSWSDLYYDAALKLSPPLAISAVWYQESDASRKSISSEGSRFDLVRGPLSYELWMGSYQIMPYPTIYPRNDLETGRWVPGLILALLAWALPLLWMGDLLLTISAMRRRAGHG